MVGVDTRYYEFAWCTKIFIKCGNQMIISWIEIGLTIDGMFNIVVKIKDNHFPFYLSYGRKLWYCKKNKIISTNMVFSMIIFRRNVNWLWICFTFHWYDWKLYLSLIFGKFQFVKKKKCDWDELRYYKLFFIYFTQFDALAIQYNKWLFNAE